MAPAAPNAARSSAPAPPTAAATPADDGIDCDHAFIDLAATPDGTIHALWLDARTGAGKGLLSAQSRDAGATWSANRVIDAHTCECCWNVLHADTAGVLYGLYRDIEPRDMTVALSADGGTTWRSLSPGGNFHWDFKGCPHVGGALAVRGAGSSARIHTLVWTGVNERAGLYYLRADAPAFIWSEAQRIGGGRARYSDLAVNSAGVVVAAWTESLADGDLVLRYQISPDDGQHWQPAVTVPSAKNGPTHPRLVVIGERFHLFWSATKAPDWHHLSLATDPFLSNDQTPHHPRAARPRSSRAPCSNRRAHTGLRQPLRVGQTRTGCRHRRPQQRRGRLRRPPAAPNAWPSPPRLRRRVQWNTRSAVKSSHSPRNAVPSSPRTTKSPATCRR